MRLLTVLLRTVVVLVLGAALVFAGSTAVQESRTQPRGVEEAAAIPRDEVSRERIPPGVVLGRQAALPAGGETLQLTPRCDPTSVRPDALALRDGMRRFDVTSWHSADGGVSAPLSDGRVVWLYGDTRREVAQGGADGLGLVSNSMLISSGGCFSQAVTADKGPVIPDPIRDGTRLSSWPTAVLSIDRGRWTELVVFTGTVRRGRGFWGFTLLGTSMTRFAVPDAGAPRRMETTQLTADDGVAGQVTWGTAVVAQGQWVYVYGTRVVGSNLGREVYVARTKLADIANVGAWRFEGDDGWGAAARMKPVVDAAPGTSHIISVFERGGEWYLVSKAGGDLADWVGVWRAAAPGAPFALVSRVPRSYSLGGAKVRYMPLAHPEFTAGRDVVVSMSRNVTNGPDVARDRSLGRPEFFTVTLPADQPRR